MSIIKKGQCAGGQCELKVVSQFVYRCSVCGYEETKTNRSGSKKCANCKGTMVEVYASFNNPETDNQV